MYTRGLLLFDLLNQYEGALALMFDRGAHSDEIVFSLLYSNIYVSLFLVFYSSVAYLIFICHIRMHLMSLPTSIGGIFLSDINYVYVHTKHFNHISLHNVSRSPSLSVSIIYTSTIYIYVCILTT